MHDSDPTPARAGAHRSRRRWRTAAGPMLALALELAAGPARPAPPAEKFVFLTNWYAEAEHGGFYQALADGLYREQGLDVSIRMGGAQLNIVQVMAAGQADCIMGSSDLQVVMARANGVPLVTVAAMFQKDPGVLIAHDDVNALADMRDRTILIAPASYQNFWPWLKQRYGFTDAQARPYTFNVQPFVADRHLVQQGYITSEPYALQKAGVPVHAFLLSDYGYPAYSTTIVCMDQTVRTRRARPRRLRARLGAGLEALPGRPGRGQCPDQARQPGHDR